ncbi:hypothetical protein [Nucisporomicrobium flavum]|uniref:hypothetical protein n=1 Tax=Nucisporomicrobium flavum TaxID=2785915 RepID=UPI0018F76C50|nr:hypothetical protein [Nucisporomicrobium flavum]
MIIQLAAVNRHAGPVATFASRMIRALDRPLTPAGFALKALDGLSSGVFDTGYQP